MNKETFLNIISDENKTLIKALENNYHRDRNNQIYTDILDYNRFGREFIIVENPNTDKMHVELWVSLEDRGTLAHDVIIFKIVDVLDLINEWLELSTEDEVQIYSTMRELLKQASTNELNCYKFLEVLICNYVSEENMIEYFKDLEARTIFKLSGI